MCLHYHGSMGGSSVIIGGTVYNQEVWGFVMGHGKGVEVQFFSTSPGGSGSLSVDQGTPSLRLGAGDPFFLQTRRSRTCIWAVEEMEDWAFPSVFAYATLKSPTAADRNPIVIVVFL